MASRSIYFNGNLERPYQLEESPTLFVVRVKKGATPDDIFGTSKEVGSYQSMLRLKATFPRSNVYVYECLTDEENFRDTFKANVVGLDDPRLIFIGSVFQFADTGVYQLYTENIFLKFYDSISEEFIEKFISENGLTVKSKLNFGKNIFFMEYTESVGRLIFEYCEKILAKEEIECCHPELVTQLHPEYKHFETTNSTTTAMLDKYWWLDRTGVFDAWKITKGKGVTIAVIDDGIELDHIAFKDRIVHPRDMLDKTMKELPLHEFGEGHGTACASVAGSSDEASFGVAPETSIMPIKITGIGSVLQSEAFYWAVKHNADVISCSWGPPDGNIFSPEDDSFEFPLPDHTRLAFEYAVTHGRNGKGCTIVFAAGNGKEPVKYDGYASSKDVFAISSINYKDGPTAYSDYGSPTLCSFPSGDNEWDENNRPINRTGIYVADRLRDLGYSKDQYNAFFTGTSASCPGVAGIVSLMYAVNPFLKQSEVRKLLTDSCEKVGGIDEYDLNGYSQNFGYGLLRADTALNKTIEFSKKQQTMATTQKKAVSLHIGINNVDTNFYGNFVSPLFGCVNDMKRMGSLALRLGYETHFLQDNEATRDAIKGKIVELGNTVEDGGILLITYAGHGAPIPDKGDSDGDTDDSTDGFDEAWVTYNGFMLDDEVNVALAEISNRIRVVTVSDSCHSESMSRVFFTNDDFKTTLISRSISPQATNAILERNGLTLEGMRSSIKTRGTKDAQVFVVSLSACGKDELAKEINGEGRFTTALLEVYNKKAAEGTIDYANFMHEIVHALDDDTQNPVLTFAHNENDSFKSQFPFSTESVALDGTGSVKKPDNGKLSQPAKPSAPVKISEEDHRPLFMEAENLLIETEDETSVTVTKESSSRSLAKDRSIKITNGAIDAKELKGHTDWDKAYNLLLANPDKNIKSVEPETISSMYHIPATESGTRSAGDYLHTYPNPQQFNDSNPFIWHLDDAHSQLKSANESVFPEIKIGKPNTSIQDIVKIGHIDTGFIENHPSTPVNLESGHVHISKGKVKKGAVDKDKKVAIAEQQGHGQATMSILAGNWVDLEETEGNYKGFFGAIPYAKVLTIKVSETVALLSGKNFAKAVDHAVDRGCDVITMSMAGLPSKVMAKAVNRAYEHGVVIVSAASNSFSKGAKKILPKRTLYPARYDRVVAATGVAYNHKPYLNRYHDGSRAAGGVYMQTCYGPDYVLPTSIAGYTPNISWFDQVTTNGDGSKTYYVKAGGGTSSATPQVAAGAAIYVQKYKKELSKFKGKDAWKKAEIVRQALFRSADKSTAYNFVYGTGIMKAHQALAPEFAPAKMLAKIEKAEKAPEKRRFLGGFFGVFGNRSMVNVGDDSMKERLEDMMVTEICQLLHKDENLFDYLDELNLEDPDFNLSENKELVKDILKSPHASDFLKQHLFVVPEPNDPLPKMTNGDHNNLVMGDPSGSLSVRATNVAYSVSNRKSYNETFEENSVWVEEFEMEVGNSRGFRSDLAPKMEIGVDSHLENMNSVMLVEKVYEEGSIYEWKYPDNISKKGTRGATKGGDNVYSFDIKEFTTNERGLIDKLKRIGVKVFKWIKPDVAVKSKLVDKVLAKFGENRYAVKVYDLKGEQTLSADGWMNIELLDKKKIYAAIQKDKKPVMVMLPGLFSTVEGGYNVFLEVPEVRKELLKTHGRYVLGFNMPTVVQGIEANANKFNELLTGQLKGKKCNVLARSRGGVVARYLFEDTWVNNKTLKPLVNAPLVLNKLIMFGTPNQGTMMASTENWKSLFNYTTNICRLALGTIAPVVPRLLTISKAVAMGVTNLPGIDDLEETSKVLERLNTMKANRGNYFVFTSNYEPNQKLLKRLFDEFLVDRAIFKRQLNDSVTPVDGAVFQNDKFESDVVLKMNQFYIASANEEVSHFGYLHPKHPQIIKKLWEVL